MLLVGLITALSIYGFSHRDQIYDGVSMAGVDLSELTRAEATQRLEAFGAAYGQTPLTLVVDGETVAKPPDEIGFDLDSAGSADRAFAFSRGDSLWSRTQHWAIALLHGAPTQAVVQVDGGALDTWLTDLAGDLRVAPVDARVDVVDGTPVLAPDQPGRDVDVGGSAVRIMSVMRRTGPGPVALATTVTQPAITAGSLEQTVPLAAAAIDAQFQFTAPENSWGISESELDLIVSVDAERRELVVDRAAVTEVVSGIASEVDRLAVNAGILVGGDGVLTVVPGQDSASVDFAATADLAVEQIAAGADAIHVVVSRAQPTITDEMAAAGIAEANGYVDPGMTLAWRGGTLELDRSDLF